jgi:hypothetical protein
VKPLPAAVARSIVFVQEPTTMFVFFDDAVANRAGDVRLEVLVGDSGDKLSAEWINPYSFSFITPSKSRDLIILMSSTASRYILVESVILY